MSVTTGTDAAGLPTFRLSHGDQEVLISAFGGQILAWTKNGVEIVFENADHAIVDGKTPYRGGAPICFSFFGKGSLLPKQTTLDGQHGEARITVWESEIDESRNAVVLTTRQPSPDGYGPTEFACELTYALDDRLSIHATIRNVGTNPSPFQFAVHTYWATPNPSAITIEGLGNRYLDNLLGLTEQTEPDSSVPHPTPYDRVYLDALDHQVLDLGHHKVDIATAGCSGSVLWNPGNPHKVSDLGSPDFVCLESGLIMPSRNLDPGDTHSLEIVYKPIPGSARL